MKAILLLVIVLLALVPIVTSISCYYGTAGVYYTSSSCDVCTSSTSSGITTKSCGGTGSGSVTCASYTSISCCSTNLCNGAKINGISVFMIIIPIMMSLFHAL